MPVPAMKPPGMTPLMLTIAVITDDRRRAVLVRRCRVSATQHKPSDREQRDHHRGDHEADHVRAVRIRRIRLRRRRWRRRRIRPQRRRQRRRDGRRRHAQEDGGTTTGAGTMTSVASGRHAERRADLPGRDVDDEQLLLTGVEHVRARVVRRQHHLVGTRAHRQRLPGRQRRGIDQQQRRAGVVNSENRSAVGGFHDVDEVRRLVHALGDLVRGRVDRLEAVAADHEQVRPRSWHDQPAQTVDRQRGLERVVGQLDRKDRRRVTAPDEELRVVGVIARSVGPQGSGRTPLTFQFGMSTTTTALAW